MAFTIPKPNLLIPKVPGVLVLGLIATQLLMLSGGSKKVPQCELKVERPHLSTSVKESRGADVLKLNVTSVCDAPQKYTTIQADIQSIHKDSQVTAFKFEQQTRNSNLKEPNTARFLGLFVKCLPSDPVLYQGRASGKVLLANGKTISVTGDSGKFYGESCRIGAK